MRLRLPSSFECVRADVADWLAWKDAPASYSTAAKIMSSCSWASPVVAGIHLGPRQVFGAFPLLHFFDVASAALLLLLPFLYPASLRWKSALTSTSSF